MTLWTDLPFQNAPPRCVAPALRPAPKAPTDAQPPLDLDLPRLRAMGREDFIVSDCNAAALTVIDSWEMWPKRQLCLTGDKGAGKTHLLHVWREESGAVVLPADVLYDADPYDLGIQPAVALDNVDALLNGGGADRERIETSLLHMYNISREVGGWLMLTARSAPPFWRVELPDLASRLNAMNRVALEPPDEILLGPLLVKLFAERQIDPPERLISYLERRIERSYSAVARAVEVLDGAGRRGAERVDTPLARRLFEAGALGGV